MAAKTMNSSHLSHWYERAFTYRVSRYQHWLADEWRADLKVLQPVVDIIIGVEGAGWELSRLSKKHEEINQCR